MKVSMAVRRFSRLILVVLGGLVLTVALAAPASARTSVDPSTLNPAPPDSFNAVCFLDGKPYHVRSGIPRPGRRGCALRHDADGNLLQRHFRESLDGTFRNPDTGLVALWTQHDTVIHNLAVPDDLATGTEAVSGVLTRVWLPDGGTILTDAGRLVQDDATGELVKLSAHHPFVLGDLAPLCAALD